MVAEKLKLVNRTIFAESQTGNKYLFWLTVITGIDANTPGPKWSQDFS